MYFTYFFILYFMLKKITVLLLFVFLLNGCTDVSESESTYEGKSAAEWHGQYLFMEATLKDVSNRHEALKQKYDTLFDCVWFSKTYSETQACVSS